jgi:hypothetical protein
MKALHDFSFWDTYPELVMLDSFNELHYQDKSKNKLESSRKMWAIYYAYNPESKFFNIPNKLYVLAKDFLKDPEFNWDTLRQQVFTYKELVLTPAERGLVNWTEIMNVRDESLKNMYKDAILERNLKELVELDKMLANTAKLFQDYKKIKQEYDEDKTTRKGKNIASLTDSGEI